MSEGSFVARPASLLGRVSLEDFSRLAEEVSKTLDGVQILLTERQKDYQESWERYQAGIQAKSGGQ